MSARLRRIRGGAGPLRVDGALPQRATHALPLDPRLRPFVERLADLLLTDLLALAPTTPQDPTKGGSGVP